MSEDIMEDKSVAKGSASPKYYEILKEMFIKLGMEKKFEKTLKSGNIQFRWEKK